jgi:hypothetical protein
MQSMKLSNIIPLSGKDTTREAGHPVPLLDVVQANMSPDTFLSFMEILDGVESHFSREIIDDLMLLMRELGWNSLGPSLDR